MLFIHGRRAAFAAVVALLLVGGPGYPNEPSESLSQFLALRGYSEVDLSENSAGQFEVDAVINGSHSARLLVDTGASRTLFGSHSFKSWGIRTKKTSIELTGIGKKQKLQSAELSNLSIGNADSGPITVFVADISFYNRQLEAIGSGEIQGLIGSDFLNKYSAILEIKNSKLYLRVD